MKKLFINDLQLNIKGDVLTDTYSLGLYATDASVYQIMPLVVVLPKDKEDVARAIKIANDHKISVLPRGGGTSLAGQTIGESMVLDFSKYLNNILEINPKERWVKVQPGITRDELNEALKVHHLHFAPDPATSSRANIGGMIGNNSSGTKSILYGKTVDHVLEVEVILADGTLLRLGEKDKSAYEEIAHTKSREGNIYHGFQHIIEDNKGAIRKAFPKVMRRVQGYNLDEFIDENRPWNLAKIIVGSEGTLATTVEATLNLEPLPRQKAVCVVHFKKLLPAIQAVESMLAYQPAAIEILDNTVLELSRKNLTTSRHAEFIVDNPAAIQIVEFYSDSKEEITKRAQEMIAHLKENSIGYAYPFFLEEDSKYDSVWMIRKKGLGLMLGLKGDKKPLPFIEDSGIPTKHLPEYIDKVLKICRKYETQAAMYAHASVGVIHVRPILDLRLKEDIERFKQISADTFQLVKSYGGSWSGEHGDGLARSFYLREYFGERVYKALKNVKRLFDPDNRMNPGKIIDAPPIDEKLRYGAAYHDCITDTIYHYREETSFENAVHACTGVGECRKILGGTMCPSFKATRDEEQSTRGRANALRLAMSGQLGEESQGLTDKRLHETLDLCLSCKACKSECPSNVDMAKLKSEVWQKKYDTYGIPLRDRLVRDTAKLSANFSGGLASVVNTVQQSNLFKTLSEKVLGIDKRRTLPTYAKTSFVKWFNNNYQPNPSAKHQVVLFADTYLNYHEPNIGIAAVKLLDACGYEVLLANVGCCQRPKISHGFLKSAKKEGTITAQQLDVFIQKGLKIVVCEPSCTSALNDDLPDLIDDEAMAKRLKENILMIDVFLAQEKTAGRLTAALTIPKTLLHGHCHQKALYGTASMKIDDNVTEIPSGCCGMAGSFGYEKEHYTISEKIGEEILFPSVREAASDTEIVACGVSCRHQIEHFTDRKAKHWVEVVEVKAI